MPTSNCKMFNKLEGQIMNLRAFAEDLRAEKDTTNRLTSPAEIQTLDDALRAVQKAEQELQRIAGDHGIACNICQSSDRF